MAKIHSFTDLIVWQKAHELILSIYDLTKKFPREETYCLVDQMKRSAISISSNIAEGFSRKGKREKLQFYFMAKGSLTELHSQALVAKDVHYLTQDELGRLVGKIESVHKLLNAFIKTAEAKY